VSQRTSSTCGLFSRAEDKVKLSDDEIEEAFTRSATVVHLYITRSAILWAFCRITAGRYEQTIGVREKEEGRVKSKHLTLAIAPAMREEWRGRCG
jgi:hypothetical protein